MSPEARKSVEKLFAEGFKPQWLKTKEELLRQSLEDHVTARVEFMYRQKAKESMERIVEKTDGGVWYNNR